MRLISLEMPLVPHNQLEGRSHERRRKSGRGSCRESRDSGVKLCAANERPLALNAICPMSMSELAIWHSSILNNCLTQEKRISHYPSADENG
jgi:hypothetical protein